MMRWSVTMILATFLFINSMAHSNDLDEVRLNYSKCINDKNLCRKLMDELEKSKNISATHLGYFGGLHAIWANHVFNPIAKLNTFKDGRRMIEDAIRKEPRNSELRLIRLSIQKNAPSFLGYKSNIKEDEDFIRANHQKFDSETLLKNADALLKN